jgi:hypothetical protein
MWLGRGERAVPAADGGHGRAGLRDERRQPRKRTGRVLRRRGFEAEPAAQDDPGLPAPAGEGQDASCLVHSAAAKSSPPTTRPRPYARDRCWAIAPSALHSVPSDCARLSASGQTSVLLLLPMTSSIGTS